MKLSRSIKPGRSIVRSMCMNENGAVLVIALMFMAILSLLGSTAYVMTSTDLQIGGNYKASVVALNDAEAGIYYAIGKIEEGLKTWPRTFTLPTSTVPSSPLLSSLTVPTGFGFTYQTTGTSPNFDITEVSEDPDIYKFTVNGTGPQNSSSVLEVECERLPAIRFGVFGDELVDVGNMAGIYSYSHDDCVASGCYPLDTGDSTNEGDIGSNESVILRNNSNVDGDVAFGEDAAGTDGTVTDQGGVVSGTNGEDIPRVDPDPLGALGGELAADFLYYSTTNDNGDATLVFDPDSSIKAGPSIEIGNNGKFLTLKGKSGGANYYFTSINVGAKSVLYIDTSNGPVNIYLTSSFDSGTGSQVLNTIDCGAGACSDCTYSGGALDCTNYTSGDVGAPRDFMLFVNSTNDPTDKITIKNSSVFSGVIYAPGIEVVMSNSAEIYGAIMAKKVDIVNNVEVYFDTDIKDEMVSNDLAIVSWRDNRM